MTESTTIGRGDGMAKPAFRVVGTSPARYEAADKVTGRAVYGADISLPRMLYGKTLRSPHAHARIRSIDPSRAAALPGVLAVVTAADLPQVGGLGAGDRYLRDNTLASDSVLYVGHAVAAVAASSPNLAEQALRLIDVEYEAVPAVLDVREAMKADAPLLHEQMHTQSLAGQSERPSNIASHFRHVKGDPERGFAQADVVLEREFRTATVHQGYIEPPSATAVWGADGMLTVYTSTAGSFAVRDELAELLHHPLSKIRVVPTEIGGGFGGKGYNYVEPLAALLARAAGRPVKMSMTREEVFLATFPTSGSFIRIRIGATRDGRLTAAQAELCFEAGAYPGSFVSSAAGVTFTAYDVPHGQIDGYDVVVNKSKSGAYRAPCATQATFAVEVVMDELAEALGMDPLEFRLLNCAGEGTRRIDGPVHGSLGSQAVLQAAMNHPHYQSLIQGAWCGRGVAHGYWGNSGERSSSAINVHDDGTVTLTTGSVDATGTRTTLAMMVAEELGLDLAQIRSSTADTDAIGYTDGTHGSRTTVATGTAVVEAARDVVRRMSARAAILWGVDTADVSFDGGVFTLKGDETRRLTFAQLAARQFETGGAVAGVGNVNVSDHGGALGTHIVDVEVDPETGRVTILRYTVVQDVGRAIHPVMVEGQIEGGTVQGIGWALYEGYQHDDQGHLLNCNLLDYKLPTMLDVPPIESVIVEVPYSQHPYGVRGVGEMPIVPPPAAIANAIFRATGVRVRQLPVTPARILEEMGVI